MPRRCVAPDCVEDVVVEGTIAHRLTACARHPSHGYRRPVNRLIALLPVSRLETGERGVDAVLSDDGRDGAQTAAREFFRSNRPPAARSHANGSKRACG